MLNNYPREGNSQLTRRDFLGWGLLGTAATAAGVVGYTFKVEPHWLEVVERRLPIAGLPNELVGRRLLQLSDLHVGPRVSDEYVVKTLRRARALAPDIVAITGDLISYVGPEQIAQLRAILREMPTGRIATVAVLGNHDYGHGWRMAEVAEAVSKELRDVGVTVLRNEAANVGGLAVIGLGDLWAHQFAPERVLAAHTGGPALVLSHNPDSLDLPVWSGFRGWVLAGHTHGGQCKPPFLPPPLLPVQNKRYTRGAIPLEDGRAVYISRGIGHLLEVRFNVRPEMTMFTLAAAPMDSRASDAVLTQT